MTETPQNFQNIDDENQVITEENHLKLMIVYIIKLLEVALSKHADMMTYQDLKVFEEASSQMSPDEKENKTPEDTEDFFKERGGQALFDEMAIEIKEWIFTFYSPLIKKAKQYPENKSLKEFHHLYLAEGYKVISKYLKKCSIKIRQMHPSLSNDRISLGMFREYLKTGSCTPTQMDSKELILHYTHTFEEYEKQARDAHERLGIFNNRIRHINLETLYSLGLIGLREEWRENQILFERIKLEYLGISAKKEQLCQKSFLSKIRKDVEKESENDEGRLYRYINLINDFLCKVSQSQNYEGSPEMEVALGAYLENK